MQWRVAIAFRACYRLCGNAKNDRFCARVIDYVANGSGGAEGSQLWNLRTRSRHLLFPLPQVRLRVGAGKLTNVVEMCLGFLFPSRYHRLKNGMEVTRAGGKKASAPRRGLPTSTMQNLSASKRNLNRDVPSDERDADVMFLQRF